jgi:hypothetical protein
MKIRTSVKAGGFTVKHKLWPRALARSYFLSVALLSPEEGFL